MNKRQDAKINMYQVVNTVCEENTPIVQSNVAFAASFANFQTTLDELFSSGARGVNVITGVAQEKTFDKENLAENANVLAGKLFAMAVKTGNLKLKAEIAFNFTPLLTTKDAQLPMVCANISAQAVANLPLLADYGVTQSTITAFDASIQTFKNSSSAPRTSISYRKTQTAFIRTTIQSLDSILREEMNKIAYGFKNVEPTFYATYLSSQRIINTAIRHRKPVTAEEKAARKAARQAQKEALKVAEAQGAAIEAANAILNTPEQP